MTITITRQRVKGKFGYKWIYDSDAPIPNAPQWKIGGYSSLASLKSYLKRVYKDAEFILTW